MRSGDETNGGRCKGIDIFVQGEIASYQDVVDAILAALVYEMKKETMN